MTYRSLLRAGVASLCAVLFTLPAQAQTQPQTQAQTQAQPQATTADDPLVVAQNTTSPQTLDEVIVTAPHLVDPLTVVTDPKKPRIPVPPMDGGGYLKNIPGFSVTRKGGAGNDPVFRGQGGSRLPMFMDGTNFGGACGGRMDASSTYVFPESYDKITIIKGPQSVRYGSMIAGGVMFDREPLRFQKTYDWYANFSALYGSFARYDLMADVAVGGESASIRGIATRSSSQNYEDGNGSRIHSRYRRNSGTIIAALTPDRDTVFQVTADFSDGEAAYSHSGPGGNDGRTLDRKAVNIFFQKENLSDLVTKVEARAWYSYIDHIMDNFSLRDVINNNYSVSNPNSANSGGRAEIELAPLDRFSLVLGTNYDYEQRQMRSAKGTSANQANAALSMPWQNNMSFNRWGVFAEGTWNLTERSKIVSGYGYGLVQATRSQRTGVTQAAKNDVLHNGFVRYEHEVNAGVPVTLYAGLGYAQRAPDYWERMKNFDLKKERNTQIDVGALHTGETWRASASLFASRVQDYMLLGYGAAGSPNAPGNSKNITAKLWGGELDAAWTFIPNWTLSGSLAYTYGQNSTDNVALAQVPPLDSRVGIGYDDKEFFGGLQMRAVSAQTRTNPGWGNVIGPDLTVGNGRTGGFTTFSAYAGWKPFSDVTLALGVDNLFNKTYAEHISRANAFADGGQYAGYDPSLRVNEPGRTFWMKGQVKF